MQGLETSVQLKLSRRQMLFKIARVVTSKLIKGEYSFAAVNEITAEQLLEKMNAGADLLIIDTRGTAEYNSGFGHLPTAISVPMMEIVETMPSAAAFRNKVKILEGQLLQAEASREREVITICPGGGFSLVAAEIMAEAGFKNVKSLAGGADGWFKKGYPTTKVKMGEDE